MYLLFATGLFQARSVLFNGIQESTSKSFAEDDEDLAPNQPISWRQLIEGFVLHILFVQCLRECCQGLRNPCLGRLLPLDRASFLMCRERRSLFWEQREESASRFP